MYKFTFVGLMLLVLSWNVTAQTYVEAPNYNQSFLLGMGIGDSTFSKKNVTSSDGGFYTIINDQSLKSASLKNKALAETYHPFLNNSEWFSVSQGFEGYDNSAFLTEGDTIINGITYAKIIESCVPLKGVNNNMYCTLNGKIGEYFVREDVPNKRIYRYFRGKGDVLVYDFGLEVGASQPQDSNYQLTTIDSIEGADGLRKRFVFKNKESHEIIWIEGVGNITSPFTPDNEVRDGQKLICSSQNGVSVYNFVNFYGITCDSFKNVLANIDKSYAPTISTYPNPTKGLFRIVFNENISHRKTIRILDLNGKPISNVGEFEGIGHIDMDISALPNGLYFCIINTDGQTSSLKIIKK